MSCPHCKAAAMSNAKFCRQCGRRVGNDCPACGISNPPGSKFCGECGYALTNSDFFGPQHVDQRIVNGKSYLVTGGERRHLTILFTDLTGYTRLMEKNDPEDIQSLMSTITRNCIRIIKAYNGHVERILGDEILGLFGIPKAHEDDAIRAIKAAKEIHETVTSMQPLVLPLGDPIAMHTGINTGLVVTARASPPNGTFDLSGDAVNLASRLSDMARPNEILVGPETYRQAFGFFNFDVMPAMQIKGKSQLISVYAVKSEKIRPEASRRNVNLCAEFIGRRNELRRLINAISELENGQGAIISIIGEAGTGKSRLLHEFECRMADKKIIWITGYAFAHTQQVPYFPLVHMVQRWLELDGSATEEQMRTAIAHRVGDLLGPQAEEIPVFQGLIGLDVPETVGMSPEKWRKRLETAIHNLLSAIAGQAPTVFIMEDIHWVDTASYRLMKEIIFNFKVPAVVICTFRPHFNLLTSHEQKSLAPMYEEFHLNEMSSTETEAMMASLLNAKSLPQNLCHLIRNRAEGNPFYMEEILNALVESKALVFKDSSWQLNRAFRDTDIPSTIYGVIAARIDQLNPQDKRILQEAAVIGRAFLYDILKQISIYAEAVDVGLYKLERAGLIHPRALHPEMEFMFKHALIQEVSYSSLLRSERQRVHERIGLTMERIYQDRLSEFDETLAIHFQKSTATNKAVDYLIRSGAKALRRCALDESDNYFQRAKTMLEKEKIKTPEIKKRLLDVVNQWAFVFHYRGLNSALLNMLEKQAPLLKELQDPVRKGFHLAWHGCALWNRHRFNQSYKKLIQARKLGEKANHPYLIGYASCWLSLTCADLGRFKEANENCKHAESLFTRGRVKDPYIYVGSLIGQGYTSWHQGDVQRTSEIGELIIQFGQRHGNVRSLVFGHCCYGYSDMIQGNTKRATSHFNNAIQISTDPWYAQIPLLASCYSSILNLQFDEALPRLNNLISFSEKNGAEVIGEPACFFKNLIEALNEKGATGIINMEKRLACWHAKGHRPWVLIGGYMMARTYAYLHEKALNRTSFEKKAAEAFAEKAVVWYQRCLQEAQSIGADAYHGQALLGLGKTWVLMKRTDRAQDVLRQSIAILGKINATQYLAQARQAMEQLPATASLS